jgi:hypothetical protein
MKVQLHRGEETVTCDQGPMVQVYQEIGFTLAEGKAKPAAGEDEWPLKSTTPAEYIELHGETEDPSATIAARLELARKLVAAEG